MAAADEVQLPRVEHVHATKDAGAPLWDAVEYGDLPYHDDRRTQEAIIAGVPPKMPVSLADKPSAKEAWDSISAARIGVDRVRRATLQRLRKEWENLSFHPGEQIEDYALHLTTLKQQMILHGERNLDEERAVEKLLRASPRSTPSSRSPSRSCSTSGPHHRGGHQEVEDGGRPRRRACARARVRRRQAHAHGGAVAGAPEEEGCGRLCFFQWRSTSTTAWREEAEGENRQGR